MSHTPGPWCVDEVNTTFVARDTRPYEYICRVEPSDFSTCEYPREEREANARLIAAAPELLDALRNLRRNMYGGSSWNDGTLKLYDDACAQADRVLSVFTESATI